MPLGRIDLFLILLGIANAHAFLRFWLDKRAAVAGVRRTPERVLLWAALAGGFGAWLGQHLLRHKTHKEPFRTRLGFVMAAHLVTVAGAIWWVIRHP